MHMRTDMFTCCVAVYVDVYVCMYIGHIYMYREDKKSKSSIHLSHLSTSYATPYVYITCAQYGTDFAPVGVYLLNICLSWPNLGSSWPKFAQSRPKLAQDCSKLA